MDQKPGNETSNTIDTGTILVTGGSGFIGSNFVRLLVRLRPGLSILVLDKLTYAGNLENLEGLVDPAGAVTTHGGTPVRFVRGDIADRELVARLLGEGVRWVVNFAAETHVDRSIDDARDFLLTNVVGTQVLIEECRRTGARLLQISTDEVYGSLPAPESATPDTNLRPSSPYSASKTAADLFVLAACHTYGQDAVITRATNNYGPYQFPEKMIPLMITQAMESRPLPVYGDGLQVRDWIHVEDHCEGVLAALERGAAGRIYHLGAGEEHSNLEIVRRLLTLLGRPDSLITHVTDRPGHDRRYSLDTTRTRQDLSWAPRHTLEHGLADTVEWYTANRGWWEKIKTGEYRAYYERLYGRRGRHGMASGSFTRRPSI